MVEHLAKECNNTQLCGSLVREIGRINPKDLGRDANGSKNLAAFLVELSERLPKEMYQNISVLIPHLDGESYTIRSGIIQILGNIVMKHSFDESNTEAAEVGSL